MCARTAPQVWIATVLSMDSWTSSSISSSVRATDARIIASVLDGRIAAPASPASQADRTRVSLRGSELLHDDRALAVECRARAGEQDRHERARAELALGELLRARGLGAGHEGHRRRQAVCHAEADGRRGSRRGRPRRRVPPWVTDGELGQADHASASAVSRRSLRCEARAAGMPGHRPIAADRWGQPRCRDAGNGGWTGRPACDDRSARWKPCSSPHRSSTQPRRPRRTHRRPHARSDDAAERRTSTTGRRCVSRAATAGPRCPTRELGAARARDRPRPDRARHSAGRPRLDPLGHARRSGRSPTSARSARARSSRRSTTRTRPSECGYVLEHAGQPAWSSARTPSRRPRSREVRDLLPRARARRDLRRRRSRTRSSLDAAARAGGGGAPTRLPTRSPGLIQPG